jgi:prepilin-type N-terminal cleavage/methylation domain-containing protein
MPRAVARGFSLVELAIVVAIIGLLLGALLVPLAAQSEMRVRRDADKALAEIREALIGYAIANGRLPCPAVATLPDGAAGAGMEARSGGNCACASDTTEASMAPHPCSTPTTTGVLPWATLSLPETDAWGRRYTYSIDTKFGRDAGQTIFGAGCTPDAPPRSAGFALCTPAAISIKAASGGAALVSGGVPALVVSHGRNGFGAYTPQGLRIAPAEAGADELENANADSVFVSNTNIDDRSVWVPTYVLMHRMLSAGMLP